MKVIEIQDDDEHIELVNNELKCLKRLQDHCEKYVLCYIDSDVSKIKIEDEDEIIETLYYVIITKFLENYISWKQFKINHPDKKSRAIKKIRKAIQHIHSQGIYHGDLHDDNILIHPETLDVRIIDFGFCMIDADPKLYENDIANFEWHLQYGMMNN